MRCRRIDIRVASSYEPLARIKSELSVKAWQAGTTQRTSRARKARGVSTLSHSAACTSTLADSSVPAKSRSLSPQACSKADRSLQERCSALTVWKNSDSVLSAATAGSH